MFFKPIFLHYFDRELTGALRFRPTTQQLIELINTTLLGTSAPLYCALSLVWEQPQSFAKMTRLIKMLVSARHLDLFSRFQSLEGFLDSKRSAYSHQRVRYPMYFTGRPTKGALIGPTQWKTSSTTERLAANLSSWAQSSAADYSSVDLPREVIQPFKEVVLACLLRRGHRAVTFPIFRERLKSSGMLKYKDSLRMVLLENYCRHYMSYGGGTILTGIPGLSALDSLGELFPFYDFRLLHEICNQLERLVQINPRTYAQWEEFLSIRGGPAHTLLVGQIQTILGSLAKTIGPSLPRRANYKARSLMLLAMRRLFLFLPTSSSSARTVEDKVLNAASIIQLAAQAYSQHNAQFAHGMEKIMNTEVAQAVVLLITATTTETRSVIEYSSLETGHEARLEYSGNLSYFDLGVVSECQVFLVQTGMGALGPSGASLTIAEAIERIRPTYLILVGIAFGLKESKQQVGDVIVSRQVMGYEPQRLGTKQRLIPRGDRTHASPLLLGRFTSAIHNWKTCGVHFGLLLSGEKLVDSPKFRSNLLTIEPEALGGDMEGYGLYSAAARMGVPWIIVKGISDWGNGEKAATEARQPLAAENATKLVMHVIKSGALAVRP